MNKKTLNKKIKIPDNRRNRLLLGWALIVGGLVGFLPVVGFWMLPLGIVVLSIDLPFARRLRRRAEVWWGRKKQKNGKQDD
ncbi:PGPGW domain-containing protein [Sneathiella chinensis]|nr:PGPGW domain-containing protein [Sneathiella chinensis]